MGNNHNCKDLKEDDCGIFQDTNQAFAREERGKSQELDNL
jgi:hypothetical protein